MNVTCDNCGAENADLIEIDTADGEIQMFLCGSCQSDLNVYGEFQKGKYKAWSQG
jgi:transposase-like protein